MKSGKNPNMPRATLVYMPRATLVLMNRYFNVHKHINDLDVNQFVSCTTRNKS